MKKTFLVCLVLIIIVGLGFFIYGVFSVRNQAGDALTRSDQKEIVIGYNADLSGGGTGSFGVSGKEGFEVAIDEINQQGGILGKKIRPVILDDEGDKEISKKNIEQLVFQEKALAIIGPANSGNALYWLDIPEDQEVTVVSPIATATEITERYQDRARNYIFRISPLDIDQIRVLVSFGLKKTKNGRIGIIHDTTGYGNNGAKDTTEVLARWGKTPAFIGSFERGASQETLQKLLVSARAAGVQGIVLYALADSNGDILRALQGVPDYHPLLLGSWSNLSPDLWNRAGDLASDLIFAAPVTQSSNEQTKVLHQKIIERSGEVKVPVFAAAAQAYDAVNLIAAAITNAHTFDKKSVRDALEEIGTLPGVVKTYTQPFSKEDHEGLTLEDISLAHWKDHQVVPYLSPKTIGLEFR